MAIKKVTMNGLKAASDAGSYRRKSDSFTAGFRLLPLKAPNTYKFRILPPNNNETLFKDSYEGFAFAFPSHYGVGDGGKESCVCPNRLAPKYRVKCPMCAEFSSGAQTGRSKLRFYYYINVILLSKIDDFPAKGPDGKFIVYTIRVPKVQVFDDLAAYCENQDRAVDDPFCMEHGCAVTISVSEKRVGKDTFPQYKVQFNEASRGDLNGKVNEDDIKDLRQIGLFIPTNAAMQNIIDGMPIGEAMSAFGKINTVTGEQVGGATESPKQDKKINVEIDADLDIDDDDGIVAEKPVDGLEDDLMLEDDEQPL
jgi:hypothetical protein